MKGITSLQSNPFLLILIVVTLFVCSVMLSSTMQDITSTSADQRPFPQPFQEAASELPASEDLPQETTSTEIVFTIPEEGTIITDPASTMGEEESAITKSPPSPPSLKKRKKPKMTGKPASSQSPLSPTVTVENDTVPPSPSTTKKSKSSELPESQSKTTRKSELSSPPPSTTRAATVASDGTTKPTSQPSISDLKLPERTKKPAKTPHRSHSRRNTVGKEASTKLAEPPPTSTTPPPEESSSIGTSSPISSEASSTETEIGTVSDRMTSMKSNDSADTVQTQGEETTSMSVKQKSTLAPAFIEERNKDRIKGWRRQGNAGAMALCACGSAMTILLTILAILLCRLLAQNKGESGVKSKESDGDGMKSDIIGDTEGEAPSSGPCSFTW
ncbi:hypothetical protein GCK32_008053 [Trichostrongylus colubriformis]|uniref:Uncharacterized protein n=1 Tax=Trichostrongylus colubriformis TaxID=6319 RepID=A0AAN8IV41_TRICO